MSTMTADQTKLQFIQDEAVVPKTMAEALDFDDPVEALKALSALAQERADAKAIQLQSQVQEFQLPLPDAFKNVGPDHSIYTATACADSIFHSLTKIASGGSQASQEIRQLEEEKREMEEHAEAVQVALMLRKNSDRATQALQARQWDVAAEAVRPWLEWKEVEEPDPRCRAYAGEYSLQQLASAHAQLKERLLSQYESAVQQGDLQTLGQLTPVLGTIQLEQDAVRLYLQFLKATLLNNIQESLEKAPPPPPRGHAPAPPPPYLPMARVYNVAVSVLRHHLPMVSYCLYKADGDAAVVQLVHVQVEEAVLPLLNSYQSERQLSTVSRNADRIYSALEERYTGRGMVDKDDDDEAADCGFAEAIGSIGDTDAAMEEAAFCIQHAESYLRFMEHTCSEVNKARMIRFDQAQKEARVERERQEWATGKAAPHVEEKKFEALQILPLFTPLHQAVAELGGQYAGIERCLLLASMQKALASSDMDPRYYRPLVGRFGESKALQTELVETCWYAARRGTQRAFATGHTGTASATANFCVGTLTGFLLEVMSRRAEEFGVAALKPGEGLLVGSTGLLNNASNLIRQGTHVTAMVQGQTKDEDIRKQEVQQQIARSCATLNDMEVAIHNTEQLETLLTEAVSKGYAAGRHETEQLVMCVKSFGSVTESFRVASNATVESLESVMKQRLRSIVGEAIGSESSSTTGFMTSSVMGGGKGADRVMIRMNYDLDEETYNLLQVSESYVSRLSTLLDELLLPLRSHLAPRLWDTLLLSVLGTVSKRLETSLRKSQFTSLGALALDSDIRDLLSYAKDRLHSPDFASNVAVARACAPLSRLLQIAKLLSVDDLEDVLDLISSAKRKGNWDLKLEDAKSLLSLRVEFETSNVNELLRLPDVD